MLGRITWWGLILVAVVLSFKSMREPDIWWMLRTGDWIMAEKSVPSVDVFSYTHEGVSWTNVKWLFELLIAAIAGIGGAESIPILQAAASAGIIAWLYKQGREQQLRLGQDAGLRWDLAFVWWGIIALLAMDFRMVGRPELVSHFFTAAYLFIFARYERDGNARGLLALIPMQILWANMHEAFGTGMVLLVLFVSGLWMRYILGRRWENLAAPLPARASLYAGIAFFGAMLHPYGPKMLLHPLNIFGQLQENKFTTELANVFAPEYWEKEAYLNLFLIAASLIGLFLAARKLKGGFIERFFSVQTPAQWLIYGALLFLSFTAYRNIPFFVLAAWWPAAFAGFWLVNSRLGQRFGDKFIAGKIVIVLFGFYLAIVTGIYHQYWRGGRDEYGLQVLRSHNPVGAAEFIAKNNLQKTRAYADYLTSSYLLWHLRPDFKTYIDLRDLDVFPTAFFQTFAATTVIPPAFEKEDSVYNFNYAVVYRPQFAALHQYFIRSEAYDLVFVDAVAAIYLKNRPENAEIIAKHGFKANGYKDIFTDLPTCRPSTLAYALSKLLNPLFTPQSIEDGHQNLIAAEFFQSIQEYKLAEIRAQKAVSNIKKDKWRAHETLGNVYNAQIGQTIEPTQREKLIQSAEMEYNKALKLNPNALNSLIGKGLVAFQTSRYMEAISALQRAHLLDPKNFSAVKYLAYSYKVRYFNEAQTPANLDNWLVYTKKMDALNPNNPFITLDLGLAYCQKNDCATTQSYLLKIEQFPDFSPEEKTALQNCLKKCAGK